MGIQFTAQLFLLLIIQMGTTPCIVRLQQRGQTIGSVFGSGSNMLHGMNIDTKFNAVDDQSDDRVMDRFEF